jgi:hypothetical protein
VALPRDREWTNKEDRLSLLLSELGRTEEKNLDQAHGRPQMHGHGGWGLRRRAGQVECGHGKVSVTWPLSPHLHRMVRGNVVGEAALQPPALPPVLLSLAHQMPGFLLGPAGAPPCP